jgi:hypothetical protein
MTKPHRPYHVFTVPINKTDIITLNLWKKFFEETPTPASIAKLDAFFNVVHHQITEFCGATNVMDSKHNFIDDIAICKRIVRNVILESITETDDHMCVHFYNAKKSYYIHLDKRSFRKHMKDMFGIKF